jgi:hypothetical protein
MAQISPLRRRMIEDMTVRNLSPATQQSYLNAVSKFSRYFSRSPDRLGLEDVHAFQLHLVATGISWPALNQIVCALRFFYGVTLGQAIVPERIAYAREPSKLPVVLSADEVVRFLEAIPSLKSRTALTTVYAAGLRVSEVAPATHSHSPVTPHDLPTHAYRDRARSQSCGQRCLHRHRAADQSLRSGMPTVPAPEIDATAPHSPRSPVPRANNLLSARTPQPRLNVKRRKAFATIPIVPSLSRLRSIRLL